MERSVNEDPGNHLFGAVRMGYVVIESLRLDKWRCFLKQGMGLHLAQSDAEQLVFRMDQHTHRIIVQKGPAEDFAAVGWQLRDDASLGLVLDRLAERGIPFEQGMAEQAELRGVKAFTRVLGPKGLALELFTTALTTDDRLHMLSSGFVTGESGMGHVAITSRLPEKMQRFWQEIFDARLSDRISQPMAGVVLDITFLRLNERHHSVAIAATRGLRFDPIRTQVQHMNMVASSLDDVVGAYTRLRDLGYEMAHEIGQHPNDLEISFYVISPSGFEIELGCDALKVQEATWRTASYNAISLWGHKPQKASLYHSLKTNLGNFFRGIRKSLRPEYSPF